MESRDPQLHGPVAAIVLYFHAEAARAIHALLQGLLDVDLGLNL